MIKRPDELATDRDIERSQETSRAIKKGIGTVASLATGAAGAGLSARILPFLSEHIPVDLAVKGISKINPKMGEFLKRGISSGLDVKEGLEFIKDKISPRQAEEKKQEAPKDNRSIIQQYSDELHQFLENEIAKGRPAIEAGALAQLDPKFKSIIKKMEQDHKTNFSSILQASYQGDYQAQVPGQSQGKSSIKDMLLGNMSPGQQVQQQQPGQGQTSVIPALQAALDNVAKIKQRRGGQ